MNNLSLEVKAKEIHEKASGYYNVSEQYAYKFVMEVKKIRDERFYKELGYSSFDDYCEEEWNINRNVIDERISVAVELGEETSGYNQRFGHRKSLLLARMPETQREHALTEGVPTEQGYKSYDEATQKEIADYKRNAEEMERKAKEYERQLKQREQENEILQRKLEEIENQEPEVIEKYMEVVPEDYEELKNLEGVLKGREKHVQQLEKEIADMRAKRSDMDKKSKEYDELNQAINEMNMKLNAGQLRLKNQKMAHDLVRDAKRLVSEVAPLVYAVEWLDLEDNEYAKKPLIEIAKNLNDVSQKIMKSLNEKQIIEVD